jgi:aryl carrier-like protein
VTLNIRTLRGDEGIVIRYWTDIMTGDEAQGLSDMLARVMETFINKPHQLVEELDLANLQLKETLGDAPQTDIVPQQQQLYSSEAQLRTIINECVREIIGQLFKSGALVSHDQEKINNTIGTATQSPIQPMIDYSQMGDLTKRPQFERSKSASTVASRRIAQLSRVEQKLLSVWSELLQISEDSIKKDDSFFQLGGDSIIAMQMVGMARDEDLALTVANIFRHPTFADMAAVIRMAEEGQLLQDVTRSQDYIEAHEARSQVIQNALYQRYSLLEAANVDAFLQDNICPRVRSFRGGIVDVFPVTDFQALAVTGTLMESKWMLNYFYLEGKGTLDFKRLKTAIFNLVESFEILRTVFVPYGNRFYQVVLRKLQSGVCVHETEDLGEFTAALQQRDRRHGPRLGESYLQFTIAKQKGTNMHRIIMRMSHAQYDGVCLPSILKALQAGYKGTTISTTPAFSTYVRDTARSTTDDHYVYWKDVLKGSLMTEIVRRHGPNYSRGTDAPTVLKRIVSISSLAAENITPATIIKAAWSLVLARWAAKSDIVFGNVISGRNAAVLGVESIIGPCVNLIPVRVNIQDGWTILDLLRCVQDQQVAAMPYESLGFREIIKNCTSWPDWTNFSTVCQHQNIRQQEEIQIGRNAYTLGAVGSQEDFADLTVLSTPQNDGQIEISLIFTSSSGISQLFAEEIFEALVETAVTFSTSPTTFLPSPAELLSSDRKTLDEDAVQVDHELSSNLRGLSRDELLVYSDVLTRAWKQILWDKSKAAAIDLDASFYELGGDIIGVAQVASLLEQEGYKLRVEDLVDHPIMFEQLALLAIYKKEERERELTEAAESARPLQAEEEAKKGLRRMLGKSVGLAKRIRQRRG